MNRADMDKVRDAFVRATEMSEAAGFDMIELHFAHGYLMSSFISPAANQRTDEYGGPLENRMRFPLEVFRAVRAAWPKAQADLTRISAVDWVEGGTTIEDAIAIARMLHEAGNDILAVSTGGVSSAQRAIRRTRLPGGVLATRSATTLKSRPWRSAASSATATPTPSSPPAAPTCARSAAATSRMPISPAMPRARRTTAGLKWPNQYRRAGEVQLRGA